MKRKLFYILVLLLMVMQGAWALNQEDGYYMIGSAQDLKDFAALVNSGNTTINGKLIAPINLQGSNENQWTPIGTYTYQYNGTFDGQGFTISNLYYKNTKEGVGLFGYAGSAARIKNVRVEGFIDTSKNSVSTAAGGTSTGGIIGSSTGATVINCSFSGSVYGFSNVGGIVGTGSVTIVNCYNEATVKFFSGNGQTGGGIHGYGGSPTIINCYNVGQIINTGSATSHIGGIATDVGSSTNCYSLVNCCQNGAGATWNNGGGHGTSGATMTSSEMQAASFVTTLNTNVESLKSTYTDIDTWKLDLYTNLPTQLSTKVSEGPWTYVDYTHGICGSKENASISWNNLNHTQWGGNVFTQINNSTNGTGFSAAGSTKEPYDAKMCIYSWYYYRQIIPSYTRMRMTWNFDLKSHLNSLAQQVGLYAHSDPDVLKSTALDFTYGNTTNAGSSYLVKIHSHAGDNQDASVNDSHIFYFDNSSGSIAQEKRNDLILTQVLWAGDATISLSYYQWATFKNNSYSFSFDYYKHVTFDANGGTGSMAQLQIENSGTLTANTFTRSGYTFAGWNTSADGSGTPYTNEAAMTATSSDKGPITLYAQWTKNTVTLTDGVDLSSSGLKSFTGKQCDVSYTREFTVDKTSTVCLPFAYTKQGTEGSFYEFTKIEKNGSGEYVATMTEPGASTLTANTPYLFTPALSSVTFTGTIASVPATFTGDYETVKNDWTFKGTFATIEWKTAPTGIYGFSAQNVDAQGISQGEFVKVGEYVRIKPMRCYLVYTGSDANWAGARRRTRAAATDEELPETISVRLVNANGNVTAIGTLHTKTGEVELDGWYTLDGTRLTGQPTRKGIYVNNGRKVVIK